MELAILISLLALFLAWRAGVRARAVEAELAALRARLAPAGLATGTEAEATDPESEPGTTPGPDVEPDPGRPAAPPSGPDALSGTPWARRPGAAPAGDAAEPEPAAAGGGWGRAGQGDQALARLGNWLRDNWIYPAAGAAMVLSGIFLVQYAVETGILTPQARVVLALILGAVLAAAGEWLRRKPAAGPVLPATLAGAGFAVAMAAVLAALHLYDMISPAVALGALALLAFGAIGLGWVHGPMLAGLGLVAGTAAPFLLGGGGTPPPALFGYFAALALAGLGIDAARRWGWVTWLALAGPLSAMLLWRSAGGDATAFALALVVVAGAAMTLPFGRIAPVAEGPRALGRAQPLPGVRASFAATAVATLGAALLVPGLAGPLALAALAALSAIWCRRAPALADQMGLAVLGLPVWIVWQGLSFGPVQGSFLAERLPESSPPLQASLVLGLAVLAGLALVWRGEAEDPGRHAPWTLAGLALPGGAVAALETVWQPAAMLGDYLWALHAMALAGLATVLALRYAARDAGQGPRLGAAAAAAFALVGLGLGLMLGQVALTLALALLMALAAGFDRRFDIPALGAFQVLAGLALLWRLVLDPGIDWHLNRAGDLAALAALVATLAGPLAALWLTRDLPEVALRRHSRLIAETTLVAASAIAAALALARFLPDAIGLHARLGLQGVVLIALSWTQIRRAGLPQPILRKLRLGLGWLMGGLAGLVLAGALAPASPVFGEWPLRERVAGWPLLNDLILAYLAPGLVLVALSGWRWLRAAGWALVAVWAALAIRHLWQGADLSLWRGIAQGELYAYTFALLLAGGVLVARAILTARADLRKLGLALVALAAAKAFLIDAAGLDGLLRVAGFLGLGLSLAALAWINGWALAREQAAQGSGTADP